MRFLVLFIGGGFLLPLAARADGPIAIAPDPAVAPVLPGRDPERQIAYELAAGRCEAALESLHSLAPTERRMHHLIWYCRAYWQCGTPNLAIGTCESVLSQRDGFTPAEYEEARNLTAQAMARLQPEPLPPPAPGAPIVPPTPEYPPWNGLHRFSFQIRPLWSIFNILGGGLIDVDYEYISKSGLLLGIDLAPISLEYPFLGIEGRLRIGYGNPWFAISAGVGYGYPISSPSVGLQIRGGRLDRTYVEFSLYWLVLTPIPLDGYFRLSTPTSERWRFKLELGGSYYVAGPYLLLGGERKLKSNPLGLRGSSAINFGIGLVFPVIVAGIPGPMLSIGYEKRF